MRRVTSITLAVCFVAVALTGLYMALAPRGPHGGPPSGFGEARGRFGPGAPDRDIEVGPAGRGFGPGEHRERFFPTELHKWSGYGTAVVGLVHVSLNFSAILCYLGLRKRRATAVEV